MGNGRMRARTCLLGLSVGDALGETFFGPEAAVRRRIEARELPEGPCPWTDDTQMAAALVAVMVRSGGSLTAEAAVEEFAAEFDIRRGYGAATRDLLFAVQRGEAAAEIVRAAFGGRGSWGNGAAMRAAPVGAWHADDLDLAAHLSRVQASATHAHPEAAEGAVAVAVAAGLMAAGEAARSGTGLLLDVAGFCRPGAVRDGLLAAAGLGPVDPQEAALELGSGREISAADTVPFALWCSAGHPDDFTEAFWATVSGLGDRDTTCAIACSVVAARVGRAGIPDGWLARVEPVGILAGG